MDDEKDKEEPEEKKDDEEERKRLEKLGEVAREWFKDKKNGNEKP